MKGLEPTLLTSLSAIVVLHPRGVASLLISAQLPAVQLEPQSWKERDLRSWEESGWVGRYLRDGKGWPETPLGWQSVVVLRKQNSTENSVIVKKRMKFLSFPRLSPPQPDLITMFLSPTILYCYVCYC